MSRTRISVVFAAFSALVLLLSACSSSQTSNTSSSASDTLAPATITLYTSEPQANADAIVADFNKIHPQIKVQVFRAATGDLSTRIAAEKAAGGVKADVLLAADAPTFEKYESAGMLLKYIPADAKSLNQDVIDPKGYYAGTRIIPTVIAYNTSLVTSPPTSWQDLADPKYANKITLPNPDVSGAAAYNTAVWLNDNRLGKTWLTALAANHPVIADSNGPVSQAVANGTQPVGIVVDYLVRTLAAKGSPIAVSYPSEGVPFVSEPVGIFAGTKSPKASEAFADYLVSKQGQTLAVKQSYLPIRSDVGTPAGAPDMKDIKLLNPDLQTITASQAAAVTTFRELFKQ